ncbi:MAG: hypothetical protein ABR543_14385, partial [Gemmatimonadaceae bacterium]
MISLDAPDNRHLPVPKAAMTHLRLLLAASILAFISSLLVGKGSAASWLPINSAGFTAPDRSVKLPPPVCTAGSHTTMTPACDSVHAARITNLTGQTVVFKVTNTSGSDESYDLTCTYTTPIASCSASSFVDVPASSTRNTTVTFSTGADTGMATLSLRATSSITSDEANWRVKVPVRFDTLKVSTDFTNNDNQNTALCANSCFAVT